ncbi:MAG: hypothetical protein V1646_01160 [bacterium]
MKKMILGLALCLGLSQVVVAQKEETRGLTEDTNAAMAWIKNNPKKVAVIAASVVAVVGVATYAGVNIRNAEADKDAKWAKTTRVKNGLYNGFVNPFVVAKDKTVAAGKFVGNKTVAGKDAVVANMKNHKKLWIGIPAGVLAIVAAAVIAEYTADEDSYLKVTNLWNKLLKKASTEEVVA